MDRIKYEFIHPPCWGHLLEKVHRAGEQVDIGSKTIQRVQIGGRLVVEEYGVDSVRVVLQLVEDH